MQANARNLLCTPGRSFEFEQAGGQFEEARGFAAARHVGRPVLEDPAELEHVGGADRQPETIAAEQSGVVRRIPDRRHGLMARVVPLEISPEGGEQASTVLAQIRSDAMEARGESWAEEEREAFKAPIRRQYETQGNPYYATARIWDDGIIDPVDTRDVLGHGIAAALNAPPEGTRYGVFRM